MEEQSEKIANIKKWMDLYGDCVMRMCLLYLKDYQDAEDAVQETFFKAYIKYDSFLGKSSEKTWIVRISINVCKNMLRKKKAAEVSMEEVLNQISVDGNFERPMIEQFVLEQIMRLPVRYKDVILLHYYQEMKVEEIAEVLHIPKSTVKTRLKRGRERLEPFLEEELLYE